MYGVGAAVISGPLAYFANGDDNGTHVYSLALKIRKFMFVSLVPADCPRCHICIFANILGPFVVYDLSTNVTRRLAPMPVAPRREPFPFSEFRD
jgi:hypothetical protein